MLRKALRKLLTPWLWNYSSAELGIGRIHYSQFGEDILIETFFRDKPNGVYVDVGCFNPIYLSNTYGLYKKGWSGVVVDANLDLREQFNRVRPRDNFQGVAIGEGSGEAEFVKYDAGMFNRLAMHSDDVPAEFRKGAKSVRVPVRTLPQILIDSGVSSFDFLNIDCEGSDLGIIETFDFSRWKPGLICIEDHSSEWSTGPISQKLGTKGYRLSGRCGLSSLFSRE